MTSPRPLSPEQVARLQNQLASLGVAATRMAASVESGILRSAANIVERRADDLLPLGVDAHTVVSELRDAAGCLEPAPKD